MGNMGMGRDLTKGMPPSAVRQGAVSQGTVMPPAGKRPAQYAAKRGRSGKFRITRRGT